jgi:hypothetical protein
MTYARAQSRQLGQVLASTVGSTAISHSFKKSATNGRRKNPESTTALALPGPRYTARIQAGVTQVVMSACTTSVARNDRGRARHGCGLQ